MNPNITKGANMGGLMRYLVDTRTEFRDGKRNVHTNPRLLSGDDFMVARFGGDELTAKDAHDIARYVETPRLVHGKKPTTAVFTQDANGAKTPVMVLDRDTGEEKQQRREQNTWHCSLSLHPDEPGLSDEKWDQIARDFMERMGFSEAPDRKGCRWVAVHHGRSGKGNDHIHIAASIIREDGKRWVPPKKFHGRDFPAAQAACRELEVAYGLRLNNGTMLGTAERGMTPKEQAAGKKIGVDQTVRRELEGRVRAAAVASTTEAEWVRRVRADGMVIKPAFAKGGTEQVRGYRVALKTDDGQPLRFIAGRYLAQDLSLPRVRECWPEASPKERAAADAEWQAAHQGKPPVARDQRDSRQLGGKAQEVAARNLEGFSKQLANVPITDRRAWQESARDVSGALSAWARYEHKFDPENAQRLREASRAVARSAQARRPGRGGRRPRPQLPMGMAFMFLAAKSQHRPEIAAQFFTEQLMIAVGQLIRVQRERGATREAERLRDGALRQLQLVSAAGYAPDSPAPAAEQGTPTRRSRAEQRSDYVEQLRAAGVDEETIRAWAVADRGRGDTPSQETGRTGKSGPTQTAARDMRREEGQDRER